MAGKVCCFYAVLYIFALPGFLRGIDLSFENKDWGYFLKPLSSSDEDINPLVRVDRFTIVNPAQPNILRANYGPFTAKHVLSPSQLSAGSNISDAVGSSMDISSHLVTPEVFRYNPVLRVLFYASQSGRDNKMKQYGRQQVCITLYVQFKKERLSTACSPNKDGFCLAEITLPSYWWPTLEDIQDSNNKKKVPKTLVQVEYSLSDVGKEVECLSNTNLPHNTQHMEMMKVFIADIPLVTAHLDYDYEEIQKDGIISIMVPKSPVYPKSKLYIPVYLHSTPGYPLYVFVIRAKVRTGLKILGAQVPQNSDWSITVDMNPKQSIATVTAFVKDIKAKSSEYSSYRQVFTWLFEIEEEATPNESGRIIWSVRYVLDSSNADQTFDDEDIKMTSKLDIQKDDIQAVLPISKNWELLNTAKLNGKQVTQPMKVFIVTQAGKVADVTLQSTCSSLDDSALKVSLSCTSVYLDGSESRGMHNASVQVKYGTYIGHAQFTVWMPELPLDIYLPDNKLSQIRGWKTAMTQKRKTRSTSDSGARDETEEAAGPITCHLRYQQTPVDVYAHFFAASSGRETYLLSRKASLRITDLVEGFLRVADTRIATLKGRIIQGQQIGRTEVQVLSPISGRVLGAREIRVVSDRIAVSALQVTVVTGLTLNVQQEEGIFSSYISETTFKHKLTAQYQEGLLDIQVHFSDGTSAYLKDIPDADYHLAADTLDSRVVAFAPMMAQHHPRVIAIGQGKGELLKVSLDLADACQKPRAQPLATAYAYIDVDFTTPTVKSHIEGVQNDGLTGTANRASERTDADVKPKPPSQLPNFRSVKIQIITEKPSISPTDNEVAHISSVPLDSDSFRDLTQTKIQQKPPEPKIQARQNPIQDRPTGMTPLEIGMYVLLGVFCLAIVVFVINCIVFATRYRRKKLPTNSDDSIAHAHDWVWLGRATLERNSINTRCSQTLLPASDFKRNHNHDENLTDSNPRLSVHSSNRNSNISYPGSEISIRITSNPNPCDDESETTITTEPHPVKASINREQSSSAHEKRVRIASQPSVFQAVIPPQTFCTPRPIIGHHSSVSTTGSATPSSSGSLSNPGTPPIIRCKGVRITSNPIPPLNVNHSSNSGYESDVQWDYEVMGMNYDQLMEYFENLKESSA